MKMVCIRPISIGLAQSTKRISNLLLYGHTKGTEVTKNCKDSQTRRLKVPGGGTLETEYTVRQLLIYQHLYILNPALQKESAIR